MSARIEATIHNPYDINIAPQSFHDFNYGFREGYNTACEYGAEIIQMTLNRHVPVDCAVENFKWALKHWSTIDQSKLKEELGRCTKRD